jgi:hypothetical protein
MRKAMVQFMTKASENLDQLLTREQTAAALTVSGFPTKAKTLATKATRGGGPPYRLYSARALYRWGDALDWAKSRLTPMICNTSERRTKKEVA